MKASSKTVTRNLVGTLRVPDWEAHAIELQKRAAWDESAREVLAELCRLFPEIERRLATAHAAHIATARTAPAPATPRRKSVRRAA